MKDRLKHDKSTKNEFEGHWLETLLIISGIALGIGLLVIISHLVG